MPRNFIPLLLLVFVTLSAIVGCGKSKPPGMPKLYPCELTIQYEDGSLVEAATVMMLPLEGRWYANGTTNSMGRVKMYTLGEFAGAAAGEFKITVRKVEEIFPSGYDRSLYHPGNPGPDPIIKYHVSEDYTLSGRTPLSFNMGTKAVKETFQVKKGK